MVVGGEIDFGVCALRSPPHQLSPHIHAERHVSSHWRLWCIPRYCLPWARLRSLDQTRKVAREWPRVILPTRFVS